MSDLTETELTSSDAFVACSNCFSNEGLHLDAERIGESESATCPRCMSIDGKKLTRDRLTALAQLFFVWGSVEKYEYGAAPTIQFNPSRKTDIAIPKSLCADVTLLEDALGIGFFHYGPRSWMFGEIEPLKILQQEGTSHGTIARILGEYGTTTLTEQDKLYRVRKDPTPPSDQRQYDSAPAQLTVGRIATDQCPALYTSPDLQTCIHECRVSAEDDLFVATLRPSRDLKLLNVATLLDEPPEVTEFESLDLAINMLFLSGKHSYPITRAIAIAALHTGFDGLVYPSYFSMLRNGVKPFETTYGISYRQIAEYKQFETAKVSSNYAIFGRPIKDCRVRVSFINRVVLSTVIYSVHFGPVFDSD